MTAAPLLPATSQVGGAYAKWGEHYNACETCQRDDWYNPPLGEALFCTDGRRLFRTWVATVALAFTAPRRLKEVAA